MARTPAQPPRLRDVAELAGVDTSTVSRVLRGSPVRARPETLERIRQSARELGYRPNAIGRGLRMSAVGALGLLVPSLRNPVLSAITRGAYERAWERGFVVVLAEDADVDDEDAVYERLVQEGRIDGLLVASARPGSPVVERLQQSSAPHVFVNRGHPGSGRNVVLREEDAGRLAAEHLLDLGHRRIGHVAGPEQLDTVRRRSGGFAAAIAEAGSEPAVIHAALDEQSGFDATRALLASADRPTGIFVTNINQAIGAIAACREAGRRVPADVSIVACDDDPIRGFLDPPLTSIRMPLHELGATAADALIRQVQGEPPTDVIIQAPPVLVPAASTSAPAA